MSRTLSESAVVRALAEHVCQRLTRRLIATLQKMSRVLLSGEDSGLRNSWDEICVEVQFEASFSWDAYDETVRRFAKAHVVKLLPHEREAIWLQTPASENWDGEVESQREPYPVLDDDIVEYLVSEYLYSEAGNWSNSRIRQYLEHGGLGY